MYIVFTNVNMKMSWGEEKKICYEKTTSAFIICKEANDCEKNQSKHKVGLSK